MLQQRIECQLPTPQHRLTLVIRLTLEKGWIHHGFEISIHARLSDIKESRNALEERNTSSRSLLTCPMTLVSNLNVVPEARGTLPTGPFGSASPSVETPFVSVPQSTCDTSAYTSL